jgi:zinc protease
MRLEAACFLALGALALPAPTNAQDTLTQIFGAEPRIERLPNGLTVISLPWESPGIVAYYTLMRVGSRDEVEEGHSGFAHLFEHMMFRGTERYPQDAYEQLLQGFGADNNAYTTQDFTLYTLTAPSTVLDRVVEVEADRFQHLRYDENAFRTETGAVRGEYDTVVSNPLIKMWEALSEISFTRHTYRHTTLGYLADIDRMPNEYAYSQRFFQRFYTPDNTTIVAVGEVDHAQLMTLVRQHYGSWRGRRDQPRIPVEPEPTAQGTRHIDWPGEAAPRLVVGYRVPGFVSGRRPADQNRALRTSAALQVIHGLAFSEPSPLYQRLVVDDRSAVEFGSWAGEHTRDPQLFVVHATLAEGGAFDPILAAIQNELDSLAQGNAAEDRLAAVKSNLRYSMLSALETPSDAADLIARVIAVGGELGMLQRYLAELAQVTVEDVSRTAREYLNANRRFVVTLARGAR